MRVETAPSGHPREPRRVATEPDARPHAAVRLGLRDRRRGAPGCTDGTAGWSTSSTLPTSENILWQVTAIRLARCATTERSCEMKRYARPSSLVQVAQQVQDRTLHRDVERRHRLITDQEPRLRARASKRSPPAASRRRSPAGCAPRSGAEAHHNGGALGRPRAGPGARLRLDRTPASARPNYSPTVFRGLSDESGVLEHDLGSASDERGRSAELRQPGSAVLRSTTRPAVGSTEPGGTQRPRVASPRIRSPPRARSTSPGGVIISVMPSTARTLFALTRSGQREPGRNPTGVRPRSHPAGTPPFRQPIRADWSGGRAARTVAAGADRSARPPRSAGHGASCEVPPAFPAPHEPIGCHPGPAARAPRHSGPPAYEHWGWNTQPAGSARDRKGARDRASAPPSPAPRGSAGRGARRV